MTQRPDVRARDIDRAIAVTALDNAYADGQLTFDEHRLRVERARVATTLADLRRLMSDLQMDVDLPEPEPRSEPPRGRVFLALGSVAVVVAGLVVFLSTRDQDDPTPVVAAVATTTTAPTVPMDLPADVTPIVARPFVFDTAEGLEDFRARYIERFGSSEVLEVSIQADADNRADVYRISADGRRERVFVAGGFEVDSSTSLLDEVEKPFDWTIVDPAVVAGLIAGAPETVGVPGAEVEYVTIENAREGQQISITVSDADRRGGRIESDFAGVITRVSVSG